MTNGLPDGAIHDRTTRTFLAVYELAREGRPVTLVDVAGATGVVKGTVPRALDRLRDEGLVEWRRSRAGTLRPAYRIVSFS